MKEKETNVYYLADSCESCFNAGSKAREDINTILLSTDFKLIKRLSRANQNKITKFICKVLDCIHLLGVNNKTIIIQYPQYGNFPIIGGKAQLNNIITRNKVYLLIHDLDYLRGNGKNKMDEISLLNKAEGLICHNEKMIAKLKEDGVVVPRLFGLQLFDYILPNAEKAPNHIFDKTVVFAGNLNKSGFIQELASGGLGFSLHLFGANYSGETNDNVIYHGACAPDKLVSQLAYSFGLVWDGNSAESCEGTLGEYTKYNNPHKFSLYMAAGLPVIVWSQAAIADFVLQNDVGLVVDSLFDISKKMTDITQEQYDTMVKNANEIREKVISGCFTRNILSQIE